MKRARRILTAPFRAGAALARYGVGVLRGLSDRESVLLVGLILLGAGLGLIYGPLALAVPGGILVIVALELHVSRGKAGE